MVAELRDRHADVPTLVVGGRSSGARVACRTAPRGRARRAWSRWPFRCTRPAGRSARRAAELATGLPTLVVNGDRDPFGVRRSRGRPCEVVSRPGETHDLRRDPAGTAAAVRDWLRAHGWAAG